MTLDATAGFGTDLTSAASNETGAEWWRTAVAYQIYPRSFADSDGDGIGDLRGIIEHLDHIADLGIDLIWLSPVYLSPQVDNGYDIADYQAIDPVFGSMADFDELIAEVHARNMRLIMDLVVNHTSDEHEWFRDSRRSRSGDRADWYIWRDPRPDHVGGTPGAEPNNWGSFFSGPAWTWVPEREQYYLHLFSPHQPDLNWDCPELRDAVFHIMAWWLDRGVDGFRMDVVSFLSKDQRLPDGVVTESGYGDGSPYFSNGPRIHEFLQEMQERVFRPRNGTYVTVGEMPMVTVEQAQRFTDDRNGELSMLFQFEHVTLDWGRHRFDVVPLTVADLKASLCRWQEGLASHGWNSLYLCNHDQPRAVSRFGDDTLYRYESATALATVVYLHRGTPFIFQGEELGMTSAEFAGVDSFLDIEAVNYYRDAVGRRGLDAEDVLAAMRRMSRDNPRGPMQWTDGPNAGFTRGVPWMPVNPNHARINAVSQAGDPTSVLGYHRRLIALRHKVTALSFGDFHMLVPDDPDVYAFARRHESGDALVVGNLSGASRSFDLDPSVDWGLPVLANHPEREGAERRRLVLKPWEARVYVRPPSNPSRGVRLRVEPGSAAEPADPTPSSVP